MHCQETFPFDAQAVESALLEYHEREDRWTVVPIHREVDVQGARILELCSKSAPGCLVHVIPVGPDSFRLKVKDGQKILVDSDLLLYAQELVAKSDDELWDLLESISRKQIRRS